MAEEKHILCMFSGGLDSLGALYTLLTEEQYAEYLIHIHHMQLLNVENRAKAENAAVKKVIAYLKEHFPNRFIYTTSGHDYRFMRKNFPFDIEIVAFVAGNIARGDRRVKKIAVGRTATDMEPSSDGLEARHVRLKRAQEVFKSVLWGVEGELAEYVFPILNKTKREIWDSVPEGLRENFWSCRRPTYQDGKPVACGKCGTCKELALVVAASN